MRSLNSMMAEFARGKDKKKRKQRTLLGSIGRGAATGAKILAPLGVIGGTALGLRMVKSPGVVEALGGRSARPFVVGTGIGGGLYGGVSGAALGAAGGAGAYGISRLRNKDKDTKRSPLSVLRK